MKKIIISLLLILGFGGWVIAQHHDDDNQPIVAKPNPITSKPDTTPVATTTPESVQTPTKTPAPAPAPKPAPTGKYADGSYTGSAVDAYYGMVQVKAIVSGGKLTDVQFLQYPNDRHESVQINREAMPLLTQEAIQAQSANVGGVSGATDTSEAFIRSLQTALNKA